MSRLHTFYAILAFALMGIISVEAKAAASSGPSYSEGKSNYFAIEPPVVVNLMEGKRMRYLQVKIQVMTRELATIQAMEEHMPPIRDGLIMLLAHQDIATMRDVVERERVREEARLMLVKLLEEHAGIVPGSKQGEGEEAVEVKGIEAVYFSDFVIQ